MYLRRLAVHLLHRVFLQVELLLELIELLPEVALVFLNIGSVGLELGHLLLLRLLLLVKLSDLGIELGKFFLECFALFQLFRVLLALKLADLQLQVLLKLVQLLVIDDSLFLLILDLLVELLQNLVKASEADRVLDLEASLLPDVALDQIFDQEVAIGLLTNLGEHIEMLIGNLALFWHPAGHLRRLHIDHVMEVLRVFQS